MADSIAEMVDNLDVGGTDGGSGTEPSKSPDSGNGSGTGSPASGSGEPSDKPADKDGTDPGQGGDDKGTGGTPDEPVPSSPGYVADEVDDDTTSEPVPEEEPATSALTPDIQYVVDRLPVLTVRGKTADGATKNYQIKAAGQLPDDFEFTSKREELTFTQAIAAQEYKAQNLLNEYNTKQTAAQAKKYADQENTDIRKDMSDLQREKLLPMFTKRSNEKGFADDPGVKAAQEVMDYMNERNQAYTREGKLYRISYRDAFEQLAKREAQETPQVKAQAKEDAERKGVSRQTAPGRGAPANPAPKARVSRSMEDLMAKIENMSFN